MKDIAGDLWHGLGKVDAICITTNGYVKKDGACVMGRGCALQAVNMFKGINYLLGAMIKRNGNIVQVIKSEEGTDLIAFPVKHVWNERADIKLIERSCLELVNIADTKGYKQVLIPRPGCGNGGLSYKDVRPVLKKHLDDRFFIVTYQ